MNQPRGYDHHAELEEQRRRMMAEEQADEINELAAQGLAEDEQYA